MYATVPTVAKPAARLVSVKQYQSSGLQRQSDFRPIHSEFAIPPLVVIYRCTALNIPHMTIDVG